MNPPSWRLLEVTPSSHPNWDTEGLTEHTKLCPSRTSSHSRASQEDDKALSTCSALEVKVLIRDSSSAAGRGALTLFGILSECLPPVPFSVMSRWEEEVLRPLPCSGSSQSPLAGRSATLSAGALPAGIGRFPGGIWICSVQGVLGEKTGDHNHERSHCFRNQ